MTESKKEIIRRMQTLGVKCEEIDSMSHFKGGTTFRELYVKEGNDLPKRLIDKVKELEDEQQDLSVYATTLVLDAKGKDDVIHIFVPYFPNSRVFKESGYSDVYSSSLRFIADVSEIVERLRFVDEHIYFFTPTRRNYSDENIFAEHENHKCIVIDPLRVKQDLKNLNGEDIKEKKEVLIKRHADEMESATRRCINAYTAEHGGAPRTVRLIRYLDGRNFYKKGIKGIDVYAYNCAVNLVIDRLVASNPDFNVWGCEYETPYEEADDVLIIDPLDITYGTK